MQLDRNDAVLDQVTLEEIVERSFVTDCDLRVFWDSGAGFAGGPSAVGQTVPELFATSPDRDRVVAGCKRALAGEPSRLEIDDGHSAAQLELVPMRDATGNVVGLVGLALDITERKRAEGEIDRREQQQAALAQISLSALRGVETMPLLEEAARLVTQTLDVEFGGVLEFCPEANVMEFRAGVGPWDADAIRRIPIPTLPGFAAWFYLRSQAPTTIEDLPNETRFAPCQLLMVHGVVSGIEVPISGKARPYGVLSANTRTRRRFTNDEINFVWSIANVLATSIEQRRVTSELEEKRERLSALSRRLLDAQEAERRAISRELHDDFGALLSALKLNLQRPGTEAENLSLVDQAIQQVRDLASDLRPAILDDLGLGDAVSWYATREARRAGLAIRLDIATICPRIGPHVEAACFRIMQEALTNVVRHAAATIVTVELDANDNRIRLSVRDDGKGFDAATVRVAAVASESHGLTNMHERAELAGGALLIESAPGQGTMVAATFPLSTERET